MHDSIREAQVALLLFDMGEIKALELEERESYSKYKGVMYHPSSCNVSILRRWSHGRVRTGTYYLTAREAARAAKIKDVSDDECQRGGGNGGDHQQAELGC